MRNLLPREVGLLLCSNTSEEYTWLKKRLVFGKAFNPNKTPFENDKQLDIYNNNIDEIITAAKTEWHPRNHDLVEDLMEGRTNCSLCNNSQNRYSFYIKNKISGEEIHVGSDCIKHFGIVPEGDLNNAIKKYRESQRRAVLVNRVPNIFERLAKWEQIFDECEYVVPDSLSKEYIQMGQQLQQYVQDFLSSNMSAEIATEHILSEISKANQLSTRIRNYDTQVVYDLSIATRSMWKWLNKMAKENLQIQKILNEVKITGKLEKQYFWRLTEKNFLKVLSPFLLIRLKELGFSNIAPLNSSAFSDNNYLLSINDVELVCKHQDLLLEGYDFFFDSNDGTKNDFLTVLLRKCRPYDERDANRLVKVLRESFRFDNIAFAPWYDRDDVNRIAIWKPKETLFGYIDTTTLSQIALIPYLTRKYDNIFIEKTIMSSVKKWITEAETKELLDVSRQFRS